MLSAIDLSRHLHASEDLPAVVERATAALRLTFYVDSSITCGTCISLNPASSWAYSWQFRLTNHLGEEETNPSEVWLTTGSSFHEPIASRVNSSLAFVLQLLLKLSTLTVCLGSTCPKKASSHVPPPRKRYEIKLIN